MNNLVSRRHVNGTLPLFFDNIVSGGKVDEKELLKFLFCTP